MNDYHDSSSSKPTDVLYYQRSSILDTVFISKVKKKPLWITVTTGPQTTLFSVSSSGRLKAAAVIRWADKEKGRKKPEVMVEIEGETYHADRFGRQSSGLYGQTSTRQFFIDNLDCRWTSMRPKASITGHEYPTIFNPSLQWECTADAFESLASSLGATSPGSKFRNFFKPISKKPRILLASYLEGSHITKPGVSIYPEGIRFTAVLLLSAIFIHVGSDFWKNQQSKASPAELEAMLSSDLRGGLPAYTPVRDSDTASTILRPTIPTHSRWSQRAQPRVDIPPLPEYTPAP